MIILCSVMSMESVTFMRMAQVTVGVQQASRDQELTVMVIVHSV